MAADRNQEAFVYDLSADARFEVLRGGSALALPVPPIGMSLQAEDRLVLHAGWVEVKGLYSGTTQRLGPVAGPARDYDIRRDALPDSRGSLREALRSFAAAFGSREEPQRVELITKGPDGVERGAVFPPVSARATPSERFLLAWDLDLAAPEVTLTWPGGRVDQTLWGAARDFELPVDFAAVLSRGGPAATAEGAVPLSWSLSDPQSGLSVEGVIEVVPDGPELLPGAERAPPGLLVGALLGQGFVFQARALLAASQPSAGGLLWPTLRRRLGFYSPRGD